MCFSHVWWRESLLAHMTEESMGSAGQPCGCCRCWVVGLRGERKTKPHLLFLTLSSRCPWGCSICEGINYPFVSERSLTNYTLADWFLRFTLETNSLRWDDEEHREKKWPQRTPLKAAFESDREFIPNWRADIIHTKCIYFKPRTLGNWLSHEADMRVILPFSLNLRPWDHLSWTWL